VSGGIASEMAKLFNMSAVLKPPTEAYELLSSGIVDAITSGIEGIAAFKLDKLVRYWTRTPGGLYRSSFGVVMNQAAYDRLSAQDKAALDSVSGEKFARKIGQHWDKSDQEGVAAMKASGVEIVTPNAKFIEMIRSKPIEDAWLNAARPKGIDGAKVLAALREEIKNVEAGR
jgi:TRAP-type C4-dicarboxylate transport system substrate-binding protein